jgi:hypothetical protein
MSINGSVASFLPFTINGLTDASFSNSVLGNAVATTLQVTSATPLKLARFNADRELVSASVDESQVALLVGGNVFNGAQTILPGSSTNINNVITTAITTEAYTAASFTTSGISGYTAPLGTLTGPVSGEYSIGQTANDRTIMRINGFVPTVRAWTYTFTIRCVDVMEAYLSVEQSGVQRSSAIRRFTAEDTVVSDTFTYDPASGPIVFKIYSGSLDPWNATWSSFTLGSYNVAITAPLSAPLLAQNIVTSTLSTQILTFPSVSSITSESWSVYAISTMGDPSSLGGLIFQESTLGVGAYITGGVVGATSFRFHTLSGNAGKVVVTNGDQVMSTSISAGQLQYITALTSQAGGVGQNNTWTGVNQFNATVSTMGSNKFIQPYNATGADISTLVNRATLDSAISAIPSLLGSNNTWSGTNTFNNTVSVNGTLSATYIGATTSYSATDDRTISPSEILANTARFYFASYPNNGGTEYADAIGFNTYSDGSGGNENLMMLRKNSIGLRIFQGGFGSTSPFSTYKDAVFSENDGSVSLSGSLSLGNRLLGSVDASPTGNFWMGLRGSGTEADRLAIAIAGNGTTGAVSLIGLNKPTTCVGLSIPTGNLDVGTGVFNKNGTTAGYGATIVGGDASHSPYMEFFANSLRRLYIGYADTTDVNIWAENSTNLNFGTNGALRMKIDPAGDTSTTGKLTVQDVVRFGNYAGGSYDNIQFMRGTGSGQYPNIRCQDNYIAMYVSDPNGWVGGSQVGDMVIRTETGNIRLGISGVAGLVLDSSNNVKLIGTLTVAETSLIGFTAIPTTYPFTGNKDLWVNGSIYSAGTNAMVATFGRNTTGTPYNEITFTAGGAGVLLAQIKSHTTGASIVDATWTYSNTNANPLGANQGQVLLTADKMSMSLTNGFIVGGLANIHGGSPAAVPSGFMATGSLTLGDTLKNYGGGTGWTSNTAGLMLECADTQEIAVHDAGARVTSLMYYNGIANTITMGRDMGWGVTDVIATNNLTAKCLIINGGGTYQAGCIYSDANWGMLFRAKVVPGAGIFGWYDSAGGEKMRINTVGQLQLTTVDGPGFVHTNGTVIVESYIGGGGGWFGTRTNHPLRFYSNNSSARMTLNTGGDMTHTAGDSSYMQYGPNSTWSASLVVGASPDRAGAGVAQVITTNGNLHADAGNNNAIYYGYYANSRGTPNSHLFYGGSYEFADVPQNEYPYAHVACFFGNRLRRSQCMMREVYKVDYIAWGGGINLVDSFYKYNAIAPVKISGKYSGYVASGGVLATMVVRVYSQSSGVYRYYPFITYQNQAYIQTTYPFELVLSSAMIPETGWFDIYIYSSFALITDINNQLHVNVQLLPVDAF